MATTDLCHPRVRWVKYRGYHLDGFNLARDRMDNQEACTQHGVKFESQEEVIVPSASPGIRRFKWRWLKLCERRVHAGIVDPSFEAFVCLCVAVASSEPFNVVDVSCPCSPVWHDNCERTPPHQQLKDGGGGGSPERRLRNSSSTPASTRY